MLRVTCIYRVSIVAVVFINEKLRQPLRGEKEQKKNITKMHWPQPRQMIRFFFVLSINIFFLMVFVFLKADLVEMLMHCGMHLKSVQKHAISKFPVNLLRTLNKIFKINLSTQCSNCFVGLLRVTFPPYPQVDKLFITHILIVIKLRQVYGGKSS